MSIVLLILVSIIIFCVVVGRCSRSCGIRFSSGFSGIIVYFCDVYFGWVNFGVFR